MRLIDADALKKQIEDFHCKDCDNYNFVRCRACHIDDAISYLEEAPTIGNWINIKDRLPEEETECLCWFGDYPLGAFARVCRWNKIKGAFWCYSDNAKWAFVTHWMPLPEPPKEVTTDD